MNLLNNLRYVSLLLITATFSAFSQNYEISITLNSRNDTVILGHYFANKDTKRADATVVLKNGKAVFRGDQKLSKGLYFIYSDGGRVFFEIIIGDNQKFGIVADTTDLFNRIQFTNSPENNVFYEFQRDNIDRNRLAQKLNEQLQNASSDDEKKEIRSQMQKLLHKERLEYVEKLINDNRNLYVSKFIRATIPSDIYVPEPTRDAEGNITNQEFRYKWWRSHFFDNLDIFDPDMLRTYFYEEKLLTYITNVVPQITDTVCIEMDKILTKTKSNDELFRCVLATFYNHYVKNVANVIAEKGVLLENVWLHLADKWYIPYSSWSSEEFIENLKKEVTNNKHSLIGMQAPPIEMLKVLPPEHFRAAVSDTAIKFDVHAGREVKDFRKELKNKYTVLFFWDYSCGHCKKYILELFELWEAAKDKGLDVITIQMIASREAKGKSIDYINEHKLFGWTNAWSPYSYKYKELYNTSTAPTLYLLDESGVIILRHRQLGVETLKEFFNAQSTINQ